MEWRNVAALVIVGIGIGFFFRSGMRALGRVVIVLLAVVVANAVSPEGLPQLAKNGVEWIYDKVAHGFSDVAEKARKTTAD